MLGVFDTWDGSSAGDGFGAFAAAATEENEAKEGAFPGFLPTPSDMAAFTPGKSKLGLLEVDGFSWVEIGGGGVGVELGWGTGFPIPKSGCVPDAQKTESMIAQSLPAWLAP